MGNPPNQPNPNEGKDMFGKLSSHFTLLEMIRSDYATRNGMDNTPTASVIEELGKLCNDVLEKVRALYSQPVTVNSGYRSEAVNIAIGGSPTSQHKKGQAADFVIIGRSNRQVVLDIIKSGIEFDQLIYEFGETGWIHISRSDNPRGKVLSAFRDSKSGRTVYVPFNE